MSNSESVPSAGFWRRIASLTYDGVLLFGVVFIAGYLFVALARDAQSGAMRLAFQIYLLTICGTYFIYCWARSGQTLAMKTWGLRLVTVGGKPLTARRALLRFLLAIPSVATGLGLVWALFDGDRRFLHDRLAGTQIIVDPAGSGVIGTTDSGSESSASTKAANNTESEVI